MAEAIDSQGNPIIRIQVGNPQGTEFEELELPVDPKARVYHPAEGPAG